jgi:hypothetical protein
VADYARCASDRRCDRVNVTRPVQRPPHVFLSFGKDHTIDNTVDTTETKAKPIFQALSKTRSQPSFQILADEGMRRQARRGDLSEGLTECHILWRNAIPDMRAQKITRVGR